MRIRLTAAVVCGLLVAGCGASDGGSQAAATTSSSTSTSTTTTVAPTTTKAPTKIDEAVRTGCKELAEAKTDDGIRRGVVFFSLSSNDDFAGPANDFIDAERSGDENGAFRALTDLNLACHAAGLL